MPSRSGPAVEKQADSGHMNTKIVLQLLILLGLLTYVLYRYHDSQPPDQAQIERCNERVKDMPENTREEINRSINTFLDCLAE